MINKNFISTFIYCLFLLFANEAVSTQYQSGESTEVVFSVIDSIKEILSRKYNSTEKNEKLIELMEKNIDIKWLTTFVIGQNKKNFTAEQLNEFNEYYKKFVLKLYYNSLSYVEDKELKIVNSIQEKNIYKITALLVSNSTNERIDIKFFMHNIDNKILIYDISISGISIALTQRDEIKEAIAANGIEGLIQKIKNSTRS